MCHSNGIRHPVLEAVYKQVDLHIVLLTDSKVCEFLVLLESVHLVYYHPLPDIHEDASLLTQRLRCDATVLYYENTIEESKFI